MSFGEKIGNALEFLGAMIKPVSPQEMAGAPCLLDDPSAVAKLKAFGLKVARLVVLALAIEFGISLVAGALDSGTPKQKIENVQPKEKKHQKTNKKHFGNLNIDTLGRTNYAFVRMAPKMQPQVQSRTMTFGNSGSARKIC